MPLKIYLMADPCSGKTSFVRTYSSYKNVTIIDFSPINKLACRKPKKGSKIAPGNDYYERITAYLHNQTDPVCVLGRRGPNKLGMLNGITIGVVIIPLEEHRRNSENRKLNHPNSRWGNFSTVIENRRILMEYATNHNIPVYESFIEAIDDLLLRAEVETINK